MEERRWLGAWRLAGAAALASCLWGCAGTAASRPDATAGTSAQQAAQVQAPLSVSTRARLRFEEAVKTLEAQRRAGVYDWVALEQKFSAALEEDHNLVEAEYNLGVLAERQGRPEQAERHYRAALARKPSLREAGHNLAVLALSRGDIPGAVSVYQQMLQHAPDDAVAWAGLADIYRRQGDHEQALKYARAALVREPQTVAAFKVMMKSHLERKQLGLARLVAQRALKVSQADPEVHLVIGQILLAENERERARAQFKLALEARMDYLPAHVMLAHMALADADYARAEAHLRRLLQADGRNAGAHLDLGVAFRGQGQADRAMLEYDTAEQLNPKLAAVYLNRAILLHRVKDAPERAVELYKKYLSMAGGDFVVTADSPVLALLKEAEHLVAAKAEAQRAEDEARREEAVQQGPREAAGPEGASPTSGRSAPEPVPSGPKEPSDEPSDVL